MMRVCDLIGLHAMEICFRKRDTGEWRMMRVLCVCVCAKRVREASPARAYRYVRPPALCLFLNQ